MKKLSCLILVILLMLAMTIPALAGATGSGTYGEYEYSWRVDCYDEYGFAGISDMTKPAYVSAYALNQVYSAENDCWGYCGSSVDGTPNTAYVSTSVRAGNTFEINGEEVSDGIVEKTWGTFWINNNLIVSNAVAIKD